MMQELEGIHEGEAKSTNNGAGGDPMRNHSDWPDSGAGQLRHCLSRDGRVIESDKG